MASKNFQMYKLSLEKAKEPDIKLTTFIGSQRKQENSRKNIYFRFIDYAKAFDCVDHNKLWKVLKEMEIPEHLTCLLRNLYAGQEATVRNDTEQQTGSRSMTSMEYLSRQERSMSRLYIVTLLI